MSFKREKQEKPSLDVAPTILRLVLLFAVSNSGLLQPRCGNGFPNFVFIFSEKKLSLL